MDNVRVGGELVVSKTMYHGFDEGLSVIQVEPGRSRWTAKDARGARSSLIALELLNGDEGTLSLLLSG